MTLGPQRRLERGERAQHRLAPERGRGAGRPHAAGREGRVMDGKSILGILLLGASQGTTIEVTVDGSDEVEAIGALAALVESGFGETP